MILPGKGKNQGSRDSCGNLYKGEGMNTISHYKGSRDSCGNLYKGEGMNTISHYNSNSNKNSNGSFIIVAIIAIVILTIAIGYIVNLPNSDSENTVLTKTELEWKEWIKKDRGIINFKKKIYLNHKSLGITYKGKIGNYGEIDKTEHYLHPKLVKVKEGGSFTSPKKRFFEWYEKNTIYSSGIVFVHEITKNYIVISWRAKISTYRFRKYLKSYLNKESWAIDIFQDLSWEIEIK